jgi:hypothetical protein
MSATRNMYDEIDEFFAENGAQITGKPDKRCRLFTALNYKGNNFNQSINTKENPETIKNEAIYQLMLAKNYKTTAGAAENVIATPFIDFVKSVGTRHIKLDGLLQDVSGSVSADTLSNIYGNWIGLSQDTRDFYMQLVNLIPTSATNQAVTSVPYSGNNMSEFRLNLKKVNMNDPLTETIFGSTLPYLPSGSVDQGGTKLAVDYLHRVYDEALRAAGRRAVFVGGASATYDAWEAAGLDVPLFLRNIAYIQQKAIRSPSGVKGELSEIYDFTTDKIYSINKDGKLVDADGNEMDDARYLADLKKGCNGTQIADKDCDLVFECLLSGDPKALSRCLGKLSVENMFVIAKSEVAKMNPKVMTKVLSTFDIRTNKHGKVEEYIEWRGSLESRLTQKLGTERGSKTTKAILDNRKLLEYLRNIMEIIRSNPVLTNANTAPLSELESKVEGKIRYFIRPTNINRAAALSTQLGTLVQQLNVLPNNFVSSLNMPLNLSNVSFGGQTGFPSAFGMRGGGCVEDSVATMEAIYKQILEEMKRNGKDLVDEDKKRIENAIDQIKKNNSQLSSALNDLKGFMKLNSALTNGLTNVSLSEIKGSSNVDLSNQIRTFESSINNTASSQVNLITALVDQVFRPMALIASGSSTNLLRPI